jgi:4a-hydroxytetrahydrobiopterin dehydratase
VRVRDWQRRGDTLVREVTFRDFGDAMRFVQHVADAAVDYLRRPDMCVSEFNRVRLTITNRHHAGITRAEQRLASKVDAVLAEQHPDAVVHGQAPPEPPPPGG